MKNNIFSLTFLKINSKTILIINFTTYWIQHDEIVSRYC